MAETPSSSQNSSTPSPSPVPSPSGGRFTRAELKNRLRKELKELASYFNVADDMEPQSDAEAAIRSGVSFKGSQLLVLIFAIFIASLGLNTNSIPVIIGAMLISPLMGPIIGMGLAIGIQDFDLLSRGLKNIGMAILGSLLASALYFLISPQYEGASQLLARTSPSIYDVFIALFGGAAGILSIACRNKGQVMPGVAIATSLMPPLCTAGYGLATLQSHFFFGALYLFFTNMIFILFASYIGVKLMRYKTVVYQNPKRAKKVQWLVYTVVAATIALSVYLTVVMVGRSIFINRAQEFVEKEMIFPNTQVLSHKEYISDGKRHIDVTLIGAALPKDSLQLAMMLKLDSVGLGGTVLDIRQGFAYSPSGNNIESRSEAEEGVFELMRQELALRDATIDSLRNCMASSAIYEKTAREITPEIKVLFPEITSMAMGRLSTSSMNGETPSDTLDILFVNAPKGLSAAERTRLKEFVEIRLGEKHLKLMVNPPSFPWNSTK